MRRTLRNVINWILRREVDLDELTFKEYLKLLESNNDDESFQLSEEMRKIARNMALSERAAGRTVGLGEIEEMKWKEIKFRLSLMREDVLNQKEALDFMLEKLEAAQEIDRADSIGAGWEGAIVAT